MTTALLTHQAIWQRLTQLARRSRSSQVAVAFFGQGASNLLPLKRHSTLVVNLEEETVRKGLTCPAELCKLHRRGVKIHNCSALHAKVFVFDNVAIVGSSNASAASARSLVEAAIEINGEAVVERRLFVESPAANRVDAKHLTRLEKIYNTVGNNSGPRPEDTELPRVWYVEIGGTNLDEDDQKAVSNAEPEAAKLLGDQSRCQLDWYRVGNAKPSENPQVGDFVYVRSVYGEPGEKIYPAAEVIEVVQYAGPGREKRMIFFMRALLLKGRLPSAVLRRVPKLRSLLDSGEFHGVIEDPDILAQLSAIWRPKKS